MLRYAPGAAATGGPTMKGRPMPSMSKGHFELIAATIASAELTAGHASYHDCEIARGQLARDFAITLAATNPRFNTRRFIDACELHDVAGD